MTLGSHQKAVGKSQVHLTPKWITDALGPFDLDPCAADPRPWDIAKTNYALPQNGLTLPWFGRVWLNPPFDRREVGRWLTKMSRHNNGIALLHARTETAWFEPIWNRAKAILFMDNRIKFCRPDGTVQAANSGAPAILVAFGSQNVAILNAIPGRVVYGWHRSDPSRATGFTEEANAASN
jgi:hypothetical protein